MRSHKEVGYIASNVLQFGQVIYIIDHAWYHDYFARCCISFSCMLPIDHCLPYRYPCFHFATNRRMYGLVFWLDKGSDFVFI